MLFDAKISKCIKVTTIPSEVRMCVTEARNQSPTIATEDANFRIFGKLFLARNVTRSCELLAFDKNVASVW